MTWNALKLVLFYAFLIQFALPKAPCKRSPIILRCKKSSVESFLVIELVGSKDEMKKKTIIG